VEIVKQPDRHGINHISKPFRSVATASACLLVASTAFASFEYDNSRRDLLLGFQKADGFSDLVVNLGPVTNYAGLSNGETMTVTSFSMDQLRSTFPNWMG